MKGFENRPVAATLYSPEAPSQAQKERFESWLSRKYGEGVTLEWVCDSSISGGFRLKVGSELYDWTTEGRMAQLDHVDHYVPEDKDKAVVMGMLRSHQLPISDPILTFGCPIGDKRRQISADQRLSEHLNDAQDENVVLA